MTASQFRRWREAMGISIAEAAKALGVTRAAITGWQSGRRSVPLSIVKLIECLKRDPALIDLTQKRK
jgi:transcriptional regulator with XRE-family HTH domain